MEQEGGGGGQSERLPCGHVEQSVMVQEEGKREEWAVDGRGGQGKGRVLIKTRRSSRSIEARCGTGVGWKVEAGYGK